jgi:hypothetical protein
MKCTLALVAGFLLVCANLQAQSTAQIQGTVQDPSGAAVPGAEIKAIQTDTSVVRTVITGADGVYVLTNLSVGPYRLEVNHQGFAPYLQTGIILQVASNPTVDVTLKVGATSEQVQVEANAALVDTERTGVGTVIENQRIIDLPLNGRNVFDLVQLAGAAIPESPGSGDVPGSFIIVVAGGQASGVAYNLDGATFNDQFDGTSLPFPFPDALQEFKVETSALSAQNGDHSAATVNAVTKSGTNSFHGDVYEFLRNGDLNARNFFATTPDTLKRNQFGGTLGGPIRKNKLFFFGGYEGTRIRQAPTGNIAYVPTAQMLAGDFSLYASAACNGGKALTLPAPFINDQISPSLFNPQSLALAAKLPTSTNACGKVNYSVPNNPNKWQSVGRMDYQVSDKQSIFARYNSTGYLLPPGDSTGGILASGAGGTNVLATSAAVGDTYLISPAIVNSLRISFNRISEHNLEDPSVSACQLGVNIYCYPAVASISEFSVTGAFSIGGALASPGGATPNIYQINDDVSMVRGAHQLGFGVSAEQLRSETGGYVGAQSNSVFSGVATGSPMADFFLGDLGSFSQSQFDPTVDRKNSIGLYAKDTWKLTPRLTVNLGLRWEPFIPQQAVSGNIYNFSLSAFEQGIKTTQYVNAPPGLTYPGDPGFQGYAGMHHQWNLWEPRVGLAWDPFGDGRTSIRASYGLSSDFVNTQFFNGTSAAPPFGNSIKITGPINFSNPWATYPGGNIFPYAVGANVIYAPFGSFVALNPNLKTTQVNQWNFAVQRQVGADWLLSATYVGSETEHLWGSYQVNPGTIVPSSYPLGTCPAGVTTGCNSTANLNQRRVLYLQNPAQAQDIGYMDEFADGGTASYNGLILALQKRLSRGVSISGNYTWSHCIGDESVGAALPGAGSGYLIPGDRRFDRGNCSSSSLSGLESSDRRQILNLTAIWQTPRLSGNVFRTIGSDWVLSGIYRYNSGPSLSVTTSTDRALSGQTNERPDQINSSSLCANPSPTCYINPASFATPALGTLTNMGTNNIPGPQFFQIDVMLSRNFRIKEFGTLTVRAEAFNVTNSFRAGAESNGFPNGLSGVNTVQGTATFGQITSALDPRILQFAMKFAF